MPVWNASPPRIGLPSARNRPALTPIPARWLTYLIMAEDVALIESKESPHSMSTQELN